MAQESLEKRKIQTGKFMKRSGFGLIIGVIIILILSAVLAFKNGFWTQKKTTQYWNKGITKFCVNNLCLQKNKDNLTYSGSGNGEANTEVVEDYVKKMKEIALDEVVSNNKDNFKDFGFSSDQKTILDIDGKKLEIGNISADYGGTYVRKENGDEVYLIPTVYDKKTLELESYWKKK